MAFSIYMVLEGRKSLAKLLCKTEKSQGDINQNETTRVALFLFSVVLLVISTFAVYTIFKTH